MPYPAGRHDQRPPSAAQAACPGLLHQVQAVDGGLCRVKLAGGRLQAAQARALAAAARRHASGVLEITNRANVQIRGVRAGAAEALVEALTAAGLGPLPAADAATRLARDQRRNLLLSPTAGLDPLVAVDTSALADDVLQALQIAPLHGLSPKFAILLDAGERLCDRAHPHDLWLQLDTPPASPPRWRLGLASAPATARATDLLGWVAAEAVSLTVVALIQAFLALAPAGTSRMRELLAAQGPAALLAQARQHGAKINPLPPELDLEPPPPCTTAERLGLHPQRQPGRCFAGFQAPLARLDATILSGLADIAERYGRGMIRLHSWQGGLLPDLADGHGEAAIQALSALGLICDPAQPLANLLACAGRHGCARSPADTKRDARWLATQPLPQGQIHLSGCPRRCAAAVPADYTLLAVAADRYDLYRQQPLRQPERCLGRQLTLEQAARVLTRGEAEPSDV